MQRSTEFAEVSQLIEELRAGKAIILVDDEDRENEGDIVVAAESITPEMIVMMNRLASGIVTVPMPAQRLRQLGIDVMVQDNLEGMHTAFTVTVDARENVSTGSSAFDRAHTIHLLADENSRAGDFVRPGHVNPLRVREGGVLRRAGHTEASHDLMVLAGLPPVAVLCEIMDDEGHMMRLDALSELAGKLDLKLGTIADLIRYRRRTERLITRVGHEEVTTRYGRFTVHHYESGVDDATYTAFVMGSPNPEGGTLVRMHAATLTRDLLASLGTHSAGALNAAFERIASEGEGVLLYIEKPKTLNARPPMDERDYGIGAQVLQDLGVRQLRLLTDRPTRRAALDGFGLSIVEFVPLTQTPAAPDAEVIDLPRERRPAGS